MKVSLIITTYNRPDALLLVLKSVELQIVKPYDIVIADDGSGNETRKLIKSFQKKTDLNIIHSWQDDLGFRAALSRNKAIAESSGEYIILIDGDMILHKNFIDDHIRFARKNYFTQGSRVLLSENLTKLVIQNYVSSFGIFSRGLQNRKNAIYSNLLSKLFSNRKNNLRGIKTCNLAFFKEDFISVNGFNNDFEGWGREDSEFIVRLMNNGIGRQNLRFKALQFHLWHHQNSVVSLDKNNLLLKKAIDFNEKWCKNGFSSVNK